VTAETLRKITAISLKTKVGLDKIIEPLLSVPPFSLGYPSKMAQSGYYPSSEHVTEQEITKVSEFMNKISIGPENTRLRKINKDGKPVLQLLQTSVETDEDGHDDVEDDIFLVRGDHPEELMRSLRACVCCGWRV
jgi:dipeptidyl-peptidase-3